MQHTHRTDMYEDTKYYNWKLTPDMCYTDKRRMEINFIKMKEL
jgi:hypothetical protein